MEIDRVSCTINPHQTWNFVPYLNATHTGKRVQWLHCSSSSELRQRLQCYNSSVRTNRKWQNTYYGNFTEYSYCSSWHRYTTTSNQPGVWYNRGIQNVYQFIICNNLFVSSSLHTFGPTKHQIEECSRKTTKHQVMKCSRNLNESTLLC